MAVSVASSPEASLETEGLFDLQLRVARKADELARNGSNRGGLSLHCWLLAEAEIIGRAAAADEGDRAGEPAPPTRSRA